MNKVHPTAIIEEGAVLGDGNVIGPYVVIREGVTVGDNNYFSPFVVIGEPPEHRQYRQISNSSITIGDGNVFREHVVVQMPLNSTTFVGCNNFFMHNSHVGHDVFVHNEVNLAPNVVLAGHVKVGSYAFIGIGSAIHQRINIAPISMIGMNSTVTNDTVIASLNYGSPARFRGWNQVGLERLGVQVDNLSGKIDEIERIISSLESSQLNVKFFSN